MTGYAENAAGHFFLEPGMEIIIKPFSTELLATKISEMMESGSGQERLMSKIINPKRRNAPRQLSVISSVGRRELTGLGQ